MNTVNMKAVLLTRLATGVFASKEHSFRLRTVRRADSSRIAIGRRPARGMTLIELLVVTVLVSILVTTAIPVLSPNNDSRKIREASRAVNAFFASAQAKAIETGRPFGVTFKRLSDDTGSVEDAGVCLELQQVEVPSTYTGLDGNSLASLSINNQYAAGRNWRAAPYFLQLVRKDDEVQDVNTATNGKLPLGYDADLFPPSFFRENDLIETQGQLFRIVGCSTPIDENGYYEQPNTSTLVQLALAPVNYVVPKSADELVQEYLGIIPTFDNNGQELPSPEVLANADNNDPAYNYCWTTPAPYRVMRQPIPSSGEPLQLPGGTAIDLGASGVNLPQIATSEDRFYTRTDSNGNVKTVVGSPTLLFTPSGGIQLQLPGEEMQPVIGTIALCIGRRELIPYEPTEGASGRYNQSEQATDYPIDLTVDIVSERLANKDGTTAESEEVREIMNKYNWLNLDTRWVVLSGRSGSIASVANSYVDPTRDPNNNANDNRFTVEEQLAVALSNAPSRQSVGGR